MYKLLNKGVNKLSPEDSLRFMLNEVETSNLSQKEIIEKLAQTADMEEALNDFGDESDDEKTNEFIMKLREKVKEKESKQPQLSWKNFDKFVEFLFKKMHMQWRTVLVCFLN